MQSLCKWDPSFWDELLAAMLPLTWVELLPDILLPLRILLLLTSGSLGFRSLYKTASMLGSKSFPGGTAQPPGVLLRGPYFVF